jgi:hypothetical protein
MTNSGRVSGRTEGCPVQRAWFLTICLMVAASLPALDTDPVLSGDFWVEVDPFVETEAGYQLTGDESRIQILEEARYVFSGIIYGFDFVYTPSDNLRDVDEIFSFEAIARIPWGDPALTIVETWVDGNLMHANVRYFPSGHQLRWLSMMQSNIYHNATASGRASMFVGTGAKYDAVTEGAKEAIRAHLRSRVLNKPKEVRGSVALTGAPYIIIDAGEYLARVDVRIDVDEIIPYRIF